MVIVGKKGQAQDWKDNRQAVARALQTYDVVEPRTEQEQCIMKRTRVRQDEGKKGISQFRAEWCGRRQDGTGQGLGSM